MADQGIESVRDHLAAAVADQGIESVRNHLAAVVADQGIESVRLAAAVADQGIESVRNHHLLKPSDCDNGVEWISGGVAGKKSLHGSQRGFVES